MTTTTTIPARDITVRRPGIDHEQPLPRYFVADDPMRSHIAAMLSSVFPEGEDFFVRSVRAYRDRIDDPELSKQVKGFIGQEAIHGREHRDFNEQLSALGYPTLGVDRIVKRFLAFLNKTTPKSHQLAVTAALEHYTATLAEALLRDDAARAEFATDEVRALFTWHALEETEHKSVAFDVYQEVSGNHVERVATMFAVHVGFLAVMSTAVAVSVAKDPKAWRRLPKSLRGLRTHPFFQRHVIARLLDYNRKGFHPDDHDTVALLEEWRARYEAGIAA
jgi:predicted metal-dependent hydrolase